jgi:hypothetical protein
MSRCLVSFVVLLASACSLDGYAIVAGPAQDDPQASGDSGTDESGSASEPPSDLPEDPIPEQAPTCALAAEQLDGLLPCELEPPSDAITPVVAWTWTGPAGEDSVLATPLVANLDDDNHDGFIDVCDHPDVVVAAVDLPANKLDVWPAGHLYVLAGDGSAAHRIDVPIDAAINPAVGDLDADGALEIVTLQAEAPNSPYQPATRWLIALRADGSVLWTGEREQSSRGGGALAIADLDADGHAEVLAPEYVANSDGSTRWALADPPLAYSMPVAVDLDGDGLLEVLYGGTAYSEDGVKLFDTPTVPSNRGSVAVANFDGDDAPELYVQHDGAHAVFEHDGSLLAVCPTSPVDVSGGGGYPVAIQDLDGDGQAELLFSALDRLNVLRVDAGTCTLAWSGKIDASDGLSSGTAFDLLGDGRAEAIYADQSQLRIYSDAGAVVYQTSRTARENVANPIVADVDGDGAGEIVVVSSEPVAGDPLAVTPTVLVLENADDRFAPARRVWNQHTYHDSNVTELGRVPTYELPHWLASNGFRANREPKASFECIPPWLAP